MGATTEVLPLGAETLSTHEWFSGRGCVVVGSDGRRQVFVGGSLIGTFGARDRAMRNAILMGLYADPNVHYGRLAAAFGISSEALRQIRAQYETEGLGAVLARRPGGSEGKVDGRLRKRLEKMFEEGVSVSEAHRRLKGKLGRSTIGFVRTAWGAGRAKGAIEAAVADTGGGEPAEREPSLSLPFASDTASAPVPSEAAIEAMGPAAEAACLVADATMTGSADTGSAAARGDVDAAPIASAAMSGGRWVQHVGAWLLLAMIAKLRLHEHAEQLRGDRVKADALRIALDAVAVALANGERCVEGVRVASRRRSRPRSCAPTTHRRRAGCVASSAASLRTSAERGFTSRWPPSTCARATTYLYSALTTTCARTRAGRPSAKDGGCRTSASCPA